MDVLTAHPVVLQAWDAALAMTRISTSSMTRFINITSIFVGQILLPNSTPTFQRTENIDTLTRLSFAMHSSLGIVRLRVNNHQARTGLRSWHDSRNRGNSWKVRRSRVPGLPSSRWQRYTPLFLVRCYLSVLSWKSMCPRSCMSTYYMHHVKIRPVDIWTKHCHWWLELVDCCRWYKWLWEPD